MTNPEEGKPNGAENEKSEFDNSTAIDMDPDESRTQLINGGAGGDDHPEKFQTVIRDPGASSSDGESFNGLGKDEVLQYANDPFWVKLRWVMFILFWVGWLAMLITAIAIIVLAPRCPHRPDLKWYHTDNIYQVYGKSFKDSNDNGIGDFEGLKDKMDYITDDDDLNTKALWLSLIYQADKGSSGMGVIDHKALDPDFIDDPDKFRSWVKKLRKEGKKVILDLIPNQTSKKHPWFVKSVKEEGDYKDYYVWASGDASNPPNNWKMVNSSESAWTYDPTRKQCYLHQFSSEYPDLNLNNSKVLEEMKDIMKYWFDAGVSGFNVRGLEYLVENPDFADDDENCTQTRNYMGTLHVLEELRKVAEDYSDKPGRERVLFATVQHANRAQIEAYWGTEDNERLHIVSPFMSSLSATCDAVCVKQMIENVISEETEEEQWLGLQVGDSDSARIATRLETGDGKYKDRLLTTHALQLLLPGTPFVYYGDEFGQRDGESSVGMDKYRAPMQWDKTENAGFTGKGVKPWTDLSEYYMEDNVEAGKVLFKDVMTPFQAYQKLTKLRHEESFQFGKTKMCTVGSDVLMFSRHASRFPYFITLVNMGDKDVTVSPSDLKCLETKDETIVRFHAQNKNVGDMVDLEDFGVHLEQYDVIVLEFAADD
ncbi:alpha-amylase [Plakobranchus ocellatus]|uniref:Alpha-amylase n=1 Tax=Plakobranchus ocellatus TaxID=259542 RepID=A0AAV4CU53_9GAST|nr:alpha-amylase [Plakobranchus ocellatus]